MERETFLRLFNQSKRIATLAILVALASTNALAVSVSTDFEGNSDADFTIGTSPSSASFTGGFSGVAGIPELYTSGSFAWMVNPNLTGTITFETNAAEVNFSARTRSLATGNSVLTTFDSSDQEIESVTLTAADGWKEFKFTGSIASITFTNNDGTHMNALDDINVEFIPIPAAFWLFVTGLLVIARPFVRHSTTMD